MPPLLSLRNVTLAFGGPPLLAGVDLTIEPGERLCLLGRNGCGKSTLLKLLAGELRPDGGEILRPQGLKVALVTQEAPPELAGSVFDIVAGGMGEAAQLLADYHHLGQHLAHSHSPLELKRLEELQKQLEASGGWQLHQEVERLIKRLDLDAEADFATLSGGTRRRVLIGRALIAAPDLLLLDEPTNHLDIDTILWLEEFLLKEVKSFVFVTHDRAFARRLANRIAELDRGRLYAFAVDYDRFVEQRDDLLAAEATKAALFDKKLAEEEVWIRQGVKARRTRNEGRVRALKKMREERRQRRERTGSARIELHEADRSGHLVAEAENVCFTYPGAATPVIRNLNTTIMRGDKIGIIGPNGAGKTTLLRLLLGELQPQSGTMRLGTRREVLYVDQLRAQLDPEKTVAENVGEGNDTLIINGKSRHIIGYLQDFLFSAERARSPVRILSGGERNRLLLAKLFTKSANLLVLDEPPNDLDTETLDLLEELLLDYSGTLLVVSHDRDFLNNVVGSTLAFDADGIVRDYVGGYDDWLRQRPVATPPAVKKVAEEKPRPRTEKARKLSFKEERELEALPEKIAALEAEQEALHAQLADPAFYKSAGAETVRLNARLAELEGELTAAYARWEELEAVKGA
ncbi:MAG: ABC transporter ATP-binding protein [Desulfuromonadales bacterium GWC2_61_20]|nr:MAG: ABC transporter ATP-binding protein [Desulfuromonadales bacterium GWC2_61_20]